VSGKIISPELFEIRFSALLAGRISISGGSFEVQNPLTYEFFNWWF